MSLDSPASLGVVLAVSLALVLVQVLDWFRRRRVIASLGDMGMIARMSNSRPYMRPLKALLFTSAMVLALLSLARPPSFDGGDPMLRDLDVIFVQSFSKQDAAEPNTAEGHRHLRQKLMQKLQQADRVGSVAFAGEVSCFPLSQDHQAASMLYQARRTAVLATGTDMVEALRVAAWLLRKDTGRPRVIILLADDSAELAVHEAEAADSTGVHYFVLSDASASEAILVALDSLRGTNLRLRKTRKNEHRRYEWFLFAAFLLLLLEVCIRARKRDLLKGRGEQ